ncbi:serine/threonine-protein kinase [Streptomyces acidiscabies]|uniref:non-specific serine/threonine protein kinase n=1 Tax=Streptomyces acidiscabies TaxID=42234 RepID=A0A0L0JTG7_9ACTN|nr:serine/threonine-protein kinase [Streptomyces acidiscabies]KND28843.1 serine/threonine protein kinase [Streptomyces acidiscabies]
MNDADSRRRIVDGRFQLEARLGSGGMGMVWRATDLVLHRSVAVKEVRPSDPDLAEYDPPAAHLLRQRVLREARALARLDHPGVVTIHHIVDEGDGTYPWIVMELVPGGSFADRLAEGPMGPVEAARIGLGVLSALRAAHDAGIQHRDVKPANVLMRPDGRPVLTDFGIAAIREATALTATGSIIGTPDYMAPERVSGQSGGPSSDLWSLGMMLYTAVEGRHPLRKGTTLATLAAVLSEDIPRPLHAGPLTDVLVRLLDRDPSARPGAQTVERLLTEVVEGGAATSYPLRPPAASAQPQTVADVPVRRRRWPAVVLPGVGVALVGVLGWTFLPEGTGGEAGPSTSRTAPSATAASGTGLLTPDGIRTGLAAIEKEAGRKRFGAVSVYADYVSADVLVDGSDTKLESYTYRPGEGAKKGSVKRLLPSVQKPFTVEGFAWDKVPALLAEAAKRLNVPHPETRFLLVNPPMTVLDIPVTLNLYLTDEYGSSGHLEADSQGKITKAYPAPK